MRGLLRNDASTLMCGLAISRLTGAGDARARLVRFPIQYWREVDVSVAEDDTKKVTGAVCGCRRLAEGIHPVTSPTVAPADGSLSLRAPARGFSTCPFRFTALARWESREVSGIHILPASLLIAAVKCL